MIEIPLSKRGKYAGLNKKAIISDEDADLADINWLFNGRYASQWNADRTKMLFIHRIVLERKLGRPLNDDEFPDHKDNDSLNNTRENLRAATRSQNRANSKKKQQNKSGYKGVYKVNSRYQAHITCNGKNFYLGAYDTPEEAHAVYYAKAKELFGEFANPGELGHVIPHFEVGQNVRLKEAIEIKASDSLKFWAASYQFQKGDAGTISMTFEANPEYVRVDLHSIEWVIESHRLEAIE